MGNRKARIAVLVSGGGTNLQAILDAAARYGYTPADITVDALIMAVN